MYRTVALNSEILTFAIRKCPCARRPRKSRGVASLLQTTATWGGLVGEGSAASIMRADVTPGQPPARCRAVSNLLYITIHHTLLLVTYTLVAYPSNNLRM